MKQTKRILSALLVLVLVLSMLEPLAVHAAGGPIITAQPTSQTVDLGSTAVFKVTATGDGLKYQWQWRPNASTAWANAGVTGNKTATLSVPGTADRNGLQYRCMITDSVGNKAYTNAVTLTVKAAAIVITAQPTNQTVNVGGTAVFKVTATGDGLKYQWQWRPNASTAWANAGVTGNKTATLSVPGTADRNGLQYRCMITDSVGNVVHTNAVTLTVKSAITVTAQPTNQTVNLGGTAKFTVTATGDGLKYQWQWRPNNAAAWANAGASGNKTATLSVPGTADRNGYQYRCEITDSLGNKAHTNVVTLTVKASAIVITSQPTNQTVTVGGTAVFKVTATGSNLTYQWQWRANASSAWAKAGVNGNKTATLSVPGTVERNGLQYRCEITDSLGNKVYTDEVTLTVKSSILITAQPTDKTVAEGGTAKFTVTATGDGLTYQWQWRPNASTAWAKAGATGNKTATLSVPGTADRNGYQYRCEITDSHGTKAYTNVVVLTVALPFTILSHPTDQTVHLGETAKFTVTATGSGLQYQWQWRSGPAMAWANAGVTGNKTATLSVPGTMDRNGLEYRCMIKDANGVTVYTSAAKLTVDDSLYIKSQPEDVTGVTTETVIASFHVEAFGGKAPYTYEWFVDDGDGWTDSLIGWSDVAGANTDTLYVVQDVAAFTAESLKFFCVVTDAAGNTATSEMAGLVAECFQIIDQDYEMDIKPSSVGYLYGSINVASMGGEKPYTYRWQYTKRGMEGYTDIPDDAQWIYYIGDDGYDTYITLNVKDYILNDDYRFRCVITDAAGNELVSEPIVIKLQAISQPADQSVYPGQKATFQFLTAGADSFQWYCQPSGSADSYPITDNPTATTDTLVVVNEDMSGCRFFCKAQGPYGEIESNLATLSTTPGPYFKVQPQSCTDLEYGADATYHVEVTGGKAPYTYQWQHSYITDISLDAEGNPVITWSKYYDSYDDPDECLGVTTDTLTVVLDDPELHFYRFRCVVTDNEGNVIYSEPASYEMKLCFWWEMEIMVDYDYRYDRVYSMHTGGAYPYTYQWEYTDDTLNGAYVSVTRETEWLYIDEYDTNPETAANRSYLNIKHDYQVTLATSGFKLRLTVTDAAGSSITCEPMGYPVLLIFPLTNQEVDINDQAQFAVQAVGGAIPYTYQWQISTRANIGAEWGDWEDIEPSESDAFEGERDVMLTFDCTGLDPNLVQVRCVITDANGDITTTDAVRAYRKFKITTQPAASTKTYVGEKLTVPVEIEGGVAPYMICLSYWSTSEEAWLVLNRTYDGSLPSLKVEEKHFGYKFHYYIEDEMGTVLTSEEFVLTNDPLRVVVQPLDIYVSYDNYVTCKPRLTVAGGKAPYSYQLQRLEDGSFVDVGNEDFSIPSIRKGLNFDKNVPMRVKITDAVGNVVYSDDFSLVDALYTHKGYSWIVPNDFLSDPEDQVVALGQQVSVELELACYYTRPEYSFSWQVNIAADGQDPHWIEITRDDYNVAMQELIYYGLAELVYVGSYDGLYNKDIRLVVTDIDGAVTISKSFRFVEPMYVSSQPKDVVCDAWEDVQFTVQVAGGKPGYTFQWQYQTKNFSNKDSWSTLSDPEVSNTANSSTLTVEVFENTLEYKYAYRCKITDAMGNVIYTNAVYPVDEEFVVVTNPKNTTARVGDQVTLVAEVAGGIPSYTYEWSYSIDGQTWKPIVATNGYLRVTVAGEPLDCTWYACKITDYRGAVVYTTTGSITVIG